MACIELGLPEAPTLPDPLTLGAELPGFEFDPKLCCKLLPFPLAVGPLPFGVVLSAAIVATINGYIDAYNSYHLAIPFPCPFE